MKAICVTWLCFWLVVWLIRLARPKKDEEFEPIILLAFLLQIAQYYTLDAIGIK